MRPMDSKANASLLHFRHGGLILVLQKVVDEVVKLDIDLVAKYVGELQAATENAPIGPYNPGIVETLMLLNLPLALVRLGPLTLRHLISNVWISSQLFYFLGITKALSLSTLKKSLRTHRHKVSCPSS
jgi:hypothetical protein